VLSAVFRSTVSLGGNASAKISKSAALKLSAWKRAAYADWRESGGYMPAQPYRAQLGKTSRWATSKITGKQHLKRGVKARWRLQQNS